MRCGAVFYLLFSIEIGQVSYLFCSTETGGLLGKLSGTYASGDLRRIECGGVAVLHVIVVIYACVQDQALVMEGILHHMYATGCCSC